MVVSGLVVSVGAAPAHAQGKSAGGLTTDKARKDGARKEYKEGERLLKLGKYREAFDHYRIADELLPIAATKYKMALCLDKQGKIVETAAAYQLFLDSSPSPDKLGDAILDARTRLDFLRRTPGKVRLSFEPPGVSKLGVQVDNGPVYAPPPDRTLALNPGHHRVTVTAPGFDPAMAEIDVAFAENRELRLVLPPAGRGGPPPPPPRVAVVVPGPGAPPSSEPAPIGPVQSRPSRIPSYVLFGVAGAGAVVGAAFGVLALGAKSDFNKAHTAANADKEQLDARIADAALFSALGLAVVGTVLLFVPRSSPQTTGAAATGPRAFVSPYFGPGGGGATGVISF
jgi:tetratricopeptide (TPR) repeat protein